MHQKRLFVGGFADGEIRPVPENDRMSFVPKVEADDYIPLGPGHVWEPWGPQVDREAYRAQTIIFYRGANRVTVRVFVPAGMSDQQGIDKAGKHLGRMTEDELREAGAVFTE